MDRGATANGLKPESICGDSCGHVQRPTLREDLMGKRSLIGCGIATFMCLQAPVRSAQQPQGIDTVAGATAGGRSDAVTVTETPSQHRHRPRERWSTREKRPQARV